MQSSARTAVLLDPHPLWLGALQRVLGSIGIEVVATTSQPEEAVELVATHRPDILVAEMRTGNGALSGAQFVRAVRERVSAVRVVALAASANPSDIESAFQAGAVAYVLKSAHPEDVAATIRQTFDHSVFLPRVVVNDRTHTPAPAEDPEELSELTRREREILALVAQGFSNKDLARQLWVTEQTVKFHLSNVYRKLDVANRTEAAHWAYRHGLVGSGQADEAAVAALA